jgi:cytoskeleton protein RodZ
MDALETPGALLRKAREQRGVSIKEMAAVTRISPRLINALENDDYDAFPAEVFVRGFLRNCGRELRMDDEALVAAYDQRNGKTLRKKAPAAAEADSSTSSLGTLFEGARLPRFAYVIAVLAIILGLGLSILIFGNSQPEQLSNSGAPTSPWTGAP